MCRECVSAYLSACFCFNDTATTEIYTLSLHDALPIYVVCQPDFVDAGGTYLGTARILQRRSDINLNSFLEHQIVRSEEHTSELQSTQYLLCRLLLEKKNINLSYIPHPITL